LVCCSRHNCAIHGHNRDPSPDDNYDTQYSECTRTVSEEEFYIFRQPPNHRKQFFSLAVDSNLPADVRHRTHYRSQEDQNLILTF
jgi:hypothetical protein